MIVRITKGKRNKTFGVYYPPVMREKAQYIQAKCGDEINVKIESTVKYSNSEEEELCVTVLQTGDLPKKDCCNFCE